MSQYSTTTNNHYDEILTNLVIGEMQGVDNFVADKIFPQYPVAKKTDKYYKWERDSFNRVGEMKPWAYGTPVENVEPKFSDDTYSCDVYALGTSMNQDEVANADAALRIRQAKLLNLTTNVRIDRERKFLNTFFAAGAWGTDWTGVASNPTATQVIHWDDYTNSNPVEDVIRMKTEMFVASGGVGRPNVALVTQDVMDVLYTHPIIIAQASGGATRANPTYRLENADVARALGLDEILVQDALENTAAEGAAEALGFMESKKFALYYRQPAGGGWMVPSAGFIFTWTAEAMNSGYGMEVHSFTGEYLQEQGIAERLQIRMAYDMKITSSNMGGIITDILS